MSLEVDDGVNPPVTTDYVWDVTRSLPVVLHDGTDRYVYGLDLISSIDASNVSYFMYDGLGSTTEVVDDTGTVDASYRYDVFGAIRSQAGSSNNPWLFTGEQRDADSGLYYLRARYYDPASGRFLGRDPIMAGHAYAYVENNPANWVDPSGMCMPGINCPPGMDDPDNSKEGGFDSGGGGDGFFDDFFPDFFSGSGVIRGNLRRCPQDILRGVEHEVKLKEDKGGPSGALWDVLCDPKNGLVYLCPPGGGDECDEWGRMEWYTDLSKGFWDYIGGDVEIIVD